MSCTSSDLEKKHLQSLKKDLGQIVGVMFTRYPVSIYALSPKMTPVKLRKVTKINMRITVKRHAHLQNLTKTLAIFKKIRLKL